MIDIISRLCTEKGSEPPIAPPIASIVAERKVCHRFDESQGPFANRNQLKFGTCQFFIFFIFFMKMAKQKPNCGVHQL
jgi:hypothetical protein